MKPPCGCKATCFHRAHPNLPAQRECKAGVRTLPVERVAPAVKRHVDRAGRVVVSLDARDLPANVLRRHRVLLGMSHAEIDAIDLQHWRATGRSGEARW